MGHREAARAAMEALELDKLLFVPAGLPPHKELSPESADPGHRRDMTALMADSLGERAQVLDLELRRRGKAYTSDTLRALRKEYPEDELWLLMGSDMFLSLQSWHEPEAVMALAGIAAFARTGLDSGAQFAAQSDRLRKQYGARIATVALPRVVEISSTALRGALAEGGGASFLWPTVYGYILREGLYGARADLRNLSDDQLRAVSWSMVRARRIPHIQGTEETAVALARHWGADRDAARRAAILHDCTKYLTLKEQLALCERYHIPLDNIERVSLPLLHAKTASALARHLFGETEPVCGAIFWHTTGRAGMTTLEKVVYLADYMEPNRDFDGVARLRALVWQDLDRAMVMGLEATAADTARRGTVVHPNTLAALADLKGT
ncbi:MAG: HD domain-containing protein [Clostridiales bacterium]|nr:HD domain-containing protein [Clostridiales bacterium]